MKSSAVLEFFKAIFQKIKHDVLPVSLVFVSGLYFLGGALKIKPFMADDLIALTTGEKPLLSFFINQFTSYFPAYRPVAQISVWLQYRLHGLSHIEFYYLVNILLLLAVSLLIYAFVVKLCKNRFAGFLSAILMLLNPKVFYSLVWIGERQNLLAVFFGLLALFLVYFYSTGKYKNTYLLIAGLSLLLSALSKEYGLAFAGSIFIFALLRKDKSIILTSLIPIAAYIGMRFVFMNNGASVNSYCEDMGLLSQAKTVCYANMPFISKIIQFSYNATASFAAVYLPIIFSPVGSVEAGFDLTLNHILQLILIFSVLLSNFVILIKKPQKTLPLVCVILFNSLLSFMLFRNRNQIVALSSLYILTGFGLAELTKILSYRLKIVALGCLVVITLFIFGSNIRNELSNYTESQLNISNICKGYQKYKDDISLEIVNGVADSYNIEKCR